MEKVRVKTRVEVSEKTLHHARKMAQANGTTVGRIFDRVMIFYLKNGGDALADEEIRQRSLLRRAPR